MACSGGIWLGTAGWPVGRALSSCPAPGEGLGYRQAAAIVSFLESLTGPIRFTEGSDRDVMCIASCGS